MKSKFPINALQKPANAFVCFPIFQFRSYYLKLREIFLYLSLLACCSFNYCNALTGSLNGDLPLANPVRNYAEQRKPTPAKFSYLAIQFRIVEGNTIIYI